MNSFYKRATKKGFLLMNGFMLMAVFGSISLFIELENWILKKTESEMIQRIHSIEKIFVKLERVQNKSFFGFKHYYFSISYWYEGKLFYKYKKVSPTLYYKYKEGNQVEAIFIKDIFGNHRIFLLSQFSDESKLSESRFENIQNISNYLFLVGSLLLIIYFYKIKR